MVVCCSTVVLDFTAVALDGAIIHSYHESAVWPPPEEQFAWSLMIEFGHADHAFCIPTYVGCDLNNGMRE